MNLETGLTRMQNRMVEAKQAVEANNTNPDCSDPFDVALSNFANANCEMDAQGDVWQHNAASWWDDRGKSRFLAWLAIQ